MLSKQIEKAQKKVEEQNFLIRKRVLEYDDVMNEQRRVIYAYRDEVLEGKPIGEEARREVANMIERTIDQYTPGDFMEDWDLDGLFTALGQFFPLDLVDEDLDPETIDRSSLTDRITELAIERYDARETELGEELMGRSSASCCCRSSTSAGVSTCSTWTTCARGSTCAALPRSIRWWHTRTKRSRCSAI